MKKRLRNPMTKKTDQNVADIALENACYKYKDDYVFSIVESLVSDKNLDNIYKQIDVEDVVNKLVVDIEYSSIPYDVSIDTVNQYLYDLHISDVDIKDILYQITNGVSSIEKRLTTLVYLSIVKTYITEKLEANAVVTIILPYDKVTVYKDHAIMLLKEHIKYFLDLLNHTVNIAFISGNRENLELIEDLKKLQI